MAARRSTSKWLLASAALCGLLGASSCLISFDHYAEGDVCDAGRDAGIELGTAPDPVLRGCDAGEPETKSKTSLESGPELEASAGAAGAEAGP